MEAPRTSWTYLKSNWHSIELKLEGGKVLLREIDGPNAPLHEESCTIEEFQNGKMQDLIKEKLPEYQVEEVMASVNFWANARQVPEKKTGFWKRLFGG